jgi:apolipoprotein N-acyltransferase
MSAAMDEVRPPSGRGRALLALTGLSGLAVWLAFPPAGIGVLAWVGLVPLFLVLSQVSPLRGLLHGLLFGAIVMGAINAFVARLGVLPWAALTLVLALYYGVFGLVASLICRRAQPTVRVPAVAGAWALLEVIRGSAGPLAFTFGDLAYSQHAQLPIAQLATLAGHYGVSFLVALLNAGLATVLLAMFPRTWWRPGSPALFNRMAGRMALACYGTVFLVFIWGSLTMRVGQGLERQRSQTGPTLTVAAVQGSVPGGDEVTNAQVRACARTYDSLSRLPEPADLIVWPETAIPTSLNTDPPNRKVVAGVARRERAHLLVGGVEEEGPRIYNAAFLVRPDGAFVGTYRKQDLVMFGEYVPFRHQLKLLRRYPIRLLDFTPGTERKLFPVKDWQIAPLICYEGIFPGPTRQVARLGADIIAIITSDVWAADSAEPWHNSITAPFRAIESRRYVVRAATNGLTAILDPYGEALAEVGYGVRGVAEARIPRVERRPSTYQRFGDAPLVLLGACFVVLGLLAKGPTAEGRGESAPPEPPSQPQP